jgi:hypothetical protein
VVFPIGAAVNRVPGVGAVLGTLGTDIAGVLVAGLLGEGINVAILTVCWRNTSEIVSDILSVLALGRQQIQRKYMS